ncbi:hypothetical protein [uncultured Microbacterium sp.]|uniref:hypothetical protein n=1 Tax=Microbacterium algeriense TaxID=2615184 RepID=UPI002592CE8A|nr:hypothetical protein [uncultured Microbacterium sp.]
MNTSSRVDVVLAEGKPTAATVEHTVTEPVETADVTPDPSRRTIVLALTKQEGRETAEALGIEPVAIVTPRSPHASVGIVADAIIEAPGLDRAVVDELMVNAGPSLATSTVDAS